MPGRDVDVFKIAVSEFKLFQLLSWRAKNPKAAQIRLRMVPARLAKFCGHMLRRLAFVCARREDAGGKVQRFYIYLK